MPLPRPALASPLGPQVKGVRAAGDPSWSCPRAQCPLLEFHSRVTPGVPIRSPTRVLKEGGPHRRAPLSAHRSPVGWSRLLARWPGEARSPVSGRRVVLRAGGGGLRREQQTQPEASGLCAGGEALTQLAECPAHRPGRHVFPLREVSGGGRAARQHHRGPGHGFHCATVTPGRLSCSACPSQQQNDCCCSSITSQVRAGDREGLRDNPFICLANVFVKSR